MSQQIEELNLTIPDSSDSEEQQRVLIENFSLLKDLVVSPGYIHFDRHKETSDSLSTTYLYIAGFDTKSTKRKFINVDLTTGAIDIDINGIYEVKVFLHVEGSASNEYEIALLDSLDTELFSYVFDAHDPGGHVYLHDDWMVNLDGPITGMHCAIRLTSGSSSVNVVHFHVSIYRIDNYNIP